ncbi:MAG: N-6 DNA methylase [Chloroflexota bacterium]|nr:N-6 DNA methylase [Chloroflexota bacterium]
MPHVNLAGNSTPAFQLRRYGYSGKTPVSVLTDFEEFCVYDCRIEPHQKDPAATARLLYSRYTDYIDKWDELESRFSREAVAQGALREWVEGERVRGILSVDQSFLRKMEEWRELLAADIALHNPGLSQRQLNLLVQRTIDRIVFLRIAEDRDIEAYRRLRSAAGEGRQVYEALKILFIEADDKYNSGLFNFGADERASQPDRDSLKIHIPDEPLRHIINNLYFPSSPFEFSVMPPEILGQVYEQFLGKVIELSPGGAVSVEEKPEVRKAGGVYYTPAYIVDYIVENTVGELLKEKTPDEAAKLRILDPACGSGSFLVGAYQCLLDWHLKYYQEHPNQFRNRRRETADGMILTTAEKRRILQDNIYGVDLDQNAVEVSKLSLLLKMLENEDGSDATGLQTVMFSAGERILPDLSDNIKWGNSLIGSDYFRGTQAGLFDDEEAMLKVKAFDWESEAGFGAIMAAGGFDAVIGNPPYGAALSTIENDYLLENYQLQNYQLDSYLLFLEKSQTLAANAGLIGVIVPNTWLLNLMTPDIRRFLIDNISIKNIVHYMTPVFRDATVDTQVNIFMNRKPADNHEVEISIITKSGNYIEHKVPQTFWKNRQGQPINIFLRAEYLPIVEKAGQFRNLDTIFKTTQGTKPFQTGKGKPKQTRQIVNDKPFVATVAKDSSFRPLLRGSLIQRYQNKWEENYYISFGDWLAEPRYSANYDAPSKIVIRQTGDSLVATLDEEQFIVRDNLYTIVQRENVTLSLKYLLGLLNSRFLCWFYQRVINHEVGEALAQVKRGHIAQLPISEIDFDNPADVAMHDKMVELVDEMLKLHKQLPALTGEGRRITEALIGTVDSEIDALVYELYGLSEDEVAIVEGG